MGLFHVNAHAYKYAMTFFLNEAIISSSHITQCKRTPDGRGLSYDNQTCFHTYKYSFSAIYIHIVWKNHFANKCINPRRHNTPSYYVAIYIYAIKIVWLILEIWVSNLMIPGTKDQSEHKRNVIKGFSSRRGHQYKSRGRSTVFDQTRPPEHTLFHKS